MRVIKSVWLPLVCLCFILQAQESESTATDDVDVDVDVDITNNNNNNNNVHQSQYDPSSNKLNIHIVPHTHDDVGWLKTVEQYYYGQNHTIRHACVSCILDSIIYALQLNPSRKFTFVEMAFFSMWWDEQPDTIKQITKELVKNGQLAFVNGGWCMHDEATTHFMGMIDQTSLGHEFLLREFGYVPKVGWQLDPFGHSATQASLLTSEAGFNALYLGRIDYQDLNKRYDTRACEGVWDASPVNLEDNAIFWGLTGSFTGNYGAPDGFCFDILCEDDPLVGMEADALESRVVDFLEKVKVQAGRSRGNNVMLTMGADFQYENAMVNYKSLDLLIDQINSIAMDEHKNNTIVSKIFPEFDGIVAFYSNPEIYTDYKYKEYRYTFDREERHGHGQGQGQGQGQEHQRSNKDTHESNDGDGDGDGVRDDDGVRAYRAEHSIANLDRKNDDFFPYSDCDHCFWTGYFTSRPSLKRLERVGSSFLHAVRQIQVQAMYLYRNKDYGQQKNSHNLRSDGTKEIDLLDRGVAIAQHHDGVSGTSKQHVAFDYAKKIQAGINEASSFVVNVLNDLLLFDNDDHGIGNGNGNGNVPAPMNMQIEYCQLRNESICELSQAETSSTNASFFLILYNALGWQRSEVVNVPISANGPYEVLRSATGGTGNDDDDNWELIQSSVVQNFNYANVEGAAAFNLLIDVQNMDPASFTFFWIKEITPKALPVSDFDSVQKDPGFQHNMRVPSTVARHLRKEHIHVPEKQPHSNTSNDKIVIDNGKIEVHFNRGVLSKVKHGPVEMDIASEWGYYQASMNSFASGPESGAYIFRPEEHAQLKYIESIPSKTLIIETELVTEVHSFYEGSWVHQIVKVYKDKAYIDVEYTVGPIPIHDGGKEVVNILKTNISNNGIFYTDSNGREFLKRERSRRQSWDLVEFEPIAGNYYPVNAAIFIEDGSSSMAVCTDRTQGGTSLQDGNIELMVHRRLLKDDSRGVGECLNETAEVMPYPPFGDASRQGEGLVITGTHRVLVGRNVTGARMARTEMDKMFSPPLSFVMKTANPGSVQVPLSSESLINTLPENVQLITLKALPSKGDENDVILLRLGHAYGKEDCKVMGVPVELDLSTIFWKHEVMNLKEMTLTGNLEKSTWQSMKMKWDMKQNRDFNGVEAESTVIILNPMEVRTFEVMLKPE